MKLDFRKVCVFGCVSGKIKLKYTSFCSIQMKCMATQVNVDKDERARQPIRTVKCTMVIVGVENCCTHDWVGFYDGLNDSTQTSAENGDDKLEWWIDNNRNWHAKDLRTMARTTTKIKANATTMATTEHSVWWMTTCLLFFQHSPHQHDTHIHI